MNLVSGQTFSQSSLSLSEHTFFRNLRTFTRCQVKDLNKNFLQWNQIHSNTSKSRKQLIWKSCVRVKPCLTNLRFLFHHLLRWQKQQHWSKLNYYFFGFSPVCSDSNVHGTLWLKYQNSNMAVPYDFPRVKIAVTNLASCLAHFKHVE